MSTDSTPLPRLAPRPPDSHKGTFGTALVIGGSRGMTGAPALGGMAALRGGAGLVRVAVPRSCLDVVAGFEPSYLTSPVAEDSAGRIAAAAVDELLELISTATVVAFGPGLGRSEELRDVVVRLYREVTRPMVVDADALNALSTVPAKLAEHGGPRILTPHPGEFARLTGQKVAVPRREAAAVELAERSGTVIVLKGHQTLVTDGRRQWHNTTGNPGMATGGSGDVLTGLTAALACQGLEPYDAARLGVYLHGLAGDLAAAELGQVSLVASDLVRYLPAAFKAHQGQTAS
jgi:ADP-dependent NAD(P)H-hydrate dehydratase